MSEKVLVTGGEGYIGSNLIEYLTGEGYKCVSVDKKSGNDVLDIDSVWKYDYIVHLAAEAGIKECRDDPNKAVVSNISSTFHIMRLAHKYDVPLVFASSGAASTPYENLYGMTKYVCEVEALRLNLKGANNHILRFSNVYGGKHWEHKPSVIPQFMNAKKEGRKLIVNGDGSQTRDFIHVLDICRAIELALHYSSINSPISIASGKQTSVLDIAKMIGCEYEFNPNSDIIGVKEAIADTEKAHIVYNFKASESLENYILTNL